MSNPAFLVMSALLSYATSKTVANITGSQELGMIAGLAAGGFAGNAMATQQAAAGVAQAGAGTSATSAGSTMGQSGGSALQSFGAEPTQLETMVSGGESILGGAGPQQPMMSPMNAGVTAQPNVGTIDKLTGGVKDFFGNLETKDLLSYGGNILGGISDAKAARDRQDYYDRSLDLEERIYNDQRSDRAEEAAYGVTRDGKVVPLNINLPTDATILGGGTALGNYSNLQTLNKPTDDTYTSGYGRFTRKTKEEEAA